MSPAGPCAPKEADTSSDVARQGHTATVDQIGEQSALLAPQWPHKLSWRPGQTWHQLHMALAITYVTDSPPAESEQTSSFSGYVLVVHSSSRLASLVPRKMKRRGSSAPQSLSSLAPSERGLLGEISISTDRLLSGTIKICVHQPIYIDRSRACLHNEVATRSAAGDSACKLRTAQLTCTIAQDSA
jgi:hypothetical protein